MNKKINLVICMLLVIIILITFLFVGCGILSSDRARGMNPVKNQVIFKAEVIDAGKGLMIAPDPESNEYKSSDKISVNPFNCKIKDKNGNEISLNELNPGDILEITYDGTVMDSYPAQIIATKIKRIDHNILIDAYLTIIDNIYQEDQGLNSDMEMLAVDTTGWIEITTMEKEIILDELKEKYQTKIKEATFDQLAKEGVIDKENLYFPKGILITISDMKYDKDKKEFTYSIQKWRSGLGAVGSSLDRANYNGTDWELTINQSWIS